jgi:hypothetical protein
MEFLKLCQKYFNRYLNAEDFLKNLKALDKDLNKNEKASFDALTTSVEEIIRETNDDSDELIEQELKQLEASIKQIDDILKKSKKVPPELKDELARMRKDAKRPRDNFDRWTRICDAIKENKLYQKRFDEMTDEQLLELIAEDMRAPRPVPIDADQFNRLVEVGIKNDRREWLWRLAFNYFDKGFDYNQIADYYIKCLDSYYLAELISAIGYALDIDPIIDQISEQISDEGFIQDFIMSRPILTPYVTEEHFRILQDK